jgi:hypothetical protein
MGEEISRVYPSDAAGYSDFSRRASGKTLIWVLGATFLITGAE